jgi:tight adherence protein B
MIFLQAFLCFATFALMGYGLAMWTQERSTARREVLNRLKSLAGTVRGESNTVLKDQRLSGIPVFDAVLTRTPLIAGIVRTIQQAGLRRRVGEVLLYIPLLGLIGYLLMTLLGFSLLIAVVVALVFAWVPIIILKSMRAKRLRLFEEQLPDALDLVRSALQAGHGLISALQVVAETFPDPVAQEFRYVVDEVRLGLPFRDALMNLTVRVGDKNIPILIVGILTAQEVGGNMAEVIENVTHTIRERAKLMRDVEVLTAQGRLSGMVLTLAPFAVGTIFYFTNRDYFGPMIERTQGHWLMAYGCLSLLIGHLWVRRIVKIEV